MSNKISQKELLSEGFWDAFGKAKEKLREKFPRTTRLASLAGSVADVVAPEIMQPIRKQKEWRDSASEKAKRASMTQDQITLDYIHEDGFHEERGEKLNWNPKRNADGTYTATIKVGELVNDPQTGDPKLGRTFSADKSTYIVKFDPKNRTAKRVRGPDRQLASSTDQIRYALEDAGYNTVGGIKITGNNRDGTINVDAYILTNIGGNQQRTLQHFIYNPSTEQVSIP
jgi:hypothetical protein